MFLHSKASDANIGIIANFFYFVKNSIAVLFDLVSTDLKHTLQILMNVHLIHAKTEQPVTMVSVNSIVVVFLASSDQYVNWVSAFCNLTQNSLKKQWGKFNRLL